MTRRGRESAAPAKPGRGDDGSRAALKALLEAYAPARLVAVSVAVGIFEALSSAPMDVAAVARSLGTAEGPTGRLLGALVALGLAQQHGAGYVLSEQGALLSEGAGGSLAPVARFIAGPGWRAWTMLEARLRAPSDPDAGSTFDDMAESGNYDLFAAQMEKAATRAGEQMAPVLQRQPDERVIDVGGGSGGVSAVLLERNPGWSCLIYDQPWAQARARSLLEARAPGRWMFASGDFFDSVPAGGRTYLLSRVLHDWDDDRALVILRNVRAAMCEDGSAFVFEKSVDASDASNDLADFSVTDLNTWLMCGGRERTLEELGDLAQAAGMKVVCRTRTSPSHWLLELSPG